MKVENYEKVESTILLATKGEPFDEHILAAIRSFNTWNAFSWP